MITFMLNIENPEPNEFEEQPNEQEAPTPNEIRDIDGKLKYWDAEEKVWRLLHFPHNN